MFGHATHHIRDRKRAPHPTANTLPKSLTKALGTISDLHINNISEKMSRIHEIEDVNGKKLVSFDVKSLFTNVLVDDVLVAI